MSLRQINVVAAALQRSSDGRYLLAKRKKIETGGGLWEFPGGKIEAKESEEQALIREIKEELSLDICNLKRNFVARHSYDYPNVRVHLSLWKVSVGLDLKKDDLRSVDLKFVLCDHDEIDWFSVIEIPKLELSPADHYFLPFL